MPEDELQNVQEVNPQNPQLQNSPIIQRGSGAGTYGNEEYEAQLNPGHASCMWDGKEFSDGGVVCQKESRTKYKCWNGRWVDIGNC